MISKKTALLLSLLAATATVFGQGRLLPSTPHNDSSRAAIQLRKLQVDIVIKDQWAETKLIHTFYNPGQRWQEAIFYYPMPREAAVRQFEMEINGQATKAELIGANKAKNIYEGIVRSMRDPALLQATGSDLLKARVFPIEARAEKVITLSYQQFIAADDGFVHYQLPLLEASPQSSNQSTLVLNLDVQATNAFRSIWSPSHQLELHRLSKKQAQATFRTNHSKAWRHFELFFSNHQNPSGLAFLTHSNQHDHFALLQIEPEISPQERLPAKDVVFILDTSGSMAGAKLQQAKNALYQCLELLNAQDRFAIVRFSTEAEAFAATLMPANKSGKIQAKAFVESFEAIGGTNIEAAFEQLAVFSASTKRSLSTLFITDGKPTIGESKPERLLQKLSSHHQAVFPIGIGSSLNTRLLDNLANQTKGFRTYLDETEDLEFKISRLFAKVNNPLLTDLTLKVEGVRFQQRTPHQLPSLFKGQSLLVMGTYQGNGPAKVILSGTLGNQKKLYSFNVHFPKKQTKHSFIPPLWAKKRVGYLLDQIRLHGENQELKDSIVSIAKRYGLVTPYTSYLILEDEQAYQHAEFHTDGVEASPLNQSREEIRTRRNQNRSRSRNLVSKASPSPRILPVAEEEKVAAKKRYHQMMEVEGEASVQASKEIQAMTELNALVDTATKSAPLGLSETTVTVLVRAGRAFYLQNDVWQDSSLKKSTPDKTHSLTFGSDAYFELLTKFPELGPILALGNKITFLHHGIVYLIRP